MSGLPKKKKVSDKAGFERQLQHHLEVVLERLKANECIERSKINESRKRNREIVHLFSFLLYQEFPKLSIKFSQCIDKKFELGGLIQQLNDTEFNLRIPLTRSIHQNAFQVR